MTTLMGLCLAVFTLLLPDLAQTSAANAVAVLDKAIQAHGGLVALQGIKDITREFEIVSSDPAQGFRPDQPSSQRIKLTSIRDVGRQRNAELQDSYPGEGEQHVANIFTADSGFGYSKTLKIAVKIPPAAVTSLRARVQRRHPEALLLNAAARPEALRYLGEESFEGKTQRVISFADIDGTEVTLFFDAATSLLTKVSLVSD